MWSPYNLNGMICGRNASVILPVAGTLQRIHTAHNSCAMITLHLQIGKIILSFKFNVITLPIAHAIIHTQMLKSMH